MSDLKKSEILPLLLVGLLGIFIAHKCTTNTEEAERQERLEEQAVIERNKPPVITEVSGFISPPEWIRLAFCLDKYKTFESKVHGDTDVQWSYKINTKSGEYFSNDHINLRTLSLTSAHKLYQPTDPSTARCHMLSFYDEFKKIPTMKYQRGYSSGMHPELNKLENQERMQFINSIKTLEVTFTDRIKNKELFSFKKVF